MFGVFAVWCVGVWLGCRGVGEAYGVKSVVFNRVLCEFDCKGKFNRKLSLLHDTMLLYSG